MGAPTGNDNPHRGRLVRDAILREAARRGGKSLSGGFDKLAKELWSLALQGDRYALAEIADRVDGKPKQQTEITGEGGGSIEVNVHLPDWLAEIIRARTAP